MQVNNRKESDTMNENLRRAIDAIQKLPDADQTVIAERLLIDLNERRWDETTAKPHIQDRLWELAQEAMNDEVEEGGFGR
jgi:hypothetical protein